MKGIIGFRLFFEYGNLFDSSSSEDEDDPEIASVTAKILKTTTNILHNIVRQVMMVIV